MFSSWYTAVIPEVVNVTVICYEFENIEPEILHACKVDYKVNHTVCRFTLYNDV